ncbi:UBX domain-containing protein 2A isoform X2 [Calypte anna]|uniref:UBX domain-containing protein 2A isoform X2 n=1 Tax=Calypte anna TaxID=9244 RepID=UPI0011C348DE|nr:UBX domain-containing protein 2A isoform X2 [Calypte anna]
MPLRAGVLWAAVLAGGAERLPGVRWQSPGCCVASADKFRMCKSGTEDEILNGKEQNCDYSIDNLFEEAQKVGDIYMPTTTVKDQVDVIIKLWKNGFTVSDGELRSYTDVANQQFLDCIKKGELPFELQKVFDKEEVVVKVEDKKDKVYLSSKKPVFHPFSGHGYRLGSATPRIISKERDDHQGLGNRQHLPLVPLNDLEPITKIQIWLADGERIIQKFNVSHRISHVRDFIMKYQGSEGSVPFILTTSLPFRVLQDETLTLEEAKLQNAVVVQRLQKTTEPFRLSVTKAPDNDHKPSATPNGQLKNEKKNTIKSARSN